MGVGSVMRTVTLPGSALTNHPVRIALECEALILLKPCDIIQSTASLNV